MRNLARTRVDRWEAPTELMAIEEQTFNDITLPLPVAKPPSLPLGLAIAAFLASWLLSMAATLLLFETKRPSPIIARPFSGDRAAQMR